MKGTLPRDLGRAGAVLHLRFGGDGQGRFVRQVVAQPFGMQGGEEVLVEQNLDL